MGTENENENKSLWSSPNQMFIVQCKKSGVPNPNILFWLVPGFATLWKTNTQHGHFRSTFYDRHSACNVSTKNKPQHKQNSISHKAKHMQPNRKKKNQCYQDSNEFWCDFQWALGTCAGISWCTQLWSRPMGVCFLPIMGIAWCMTHALSWTW
jgi:hypothetical protein